MKDDALFCDVFDEFAEQELPSKTVSCTLFEHRNPLFGSYDGWKLASRDDYFSEREEEMPIDEHDFFAYVREGAEEETCGSADEDERARITAYLHRKLGLYLADQDVEQAYAAKCGERREIWQEDIYTK